MKKSRRSFLLGMLALGLPVRAAAQGFPGGLGEALGPRFSARADVTDPRLRRPRRGAGVLERVRHWNEVAIDASGLDHTPVAPGEPRVFGEQLGPGRASRAMAIVHIAMFDAVNAIARRLPELHGVAPPRRWAHPMEAAIAQAAHDTLVALFPSQKATFDELLADGARARSRTAAPRRTASSSARRAAAAILALRADDGSQHRRAARRHRLHHRRRAGPVAAGSDQPASARAGRALGRGRAVRAASRATQFRVPPPPALDSRRTRPRSTR